MWIESPPPPRKQMVSASNAVLTLQAKACECVVIFKVIDRLGCRDRGTVEPFVVVDVVRLYQSTHACTHRASHGGRTQRHRQARRARKEGGGSTANMDKLARRYKARITVNRTPKACTAKTRQRGRWWAQQKVRTDDRYLVYISLTPSRQSGHFVKDLVGL